MSTKKRFLIISAYFLACLMLMFSYIMLADSSTTEKATLILKITFSLFAAGAVFIGGIFTRIFSCKPWVFFVGIIYSVIVSIIPLYFCNWAFTEEIILILNNGDSPSFSITRDVGLSYFIYIVAIFVGTYIITHLCYKFANWWSGRSLMKELAMTNRKQTKIDKPMILKSYNKRSNKYEKYLVWQTKSGKVMSSDKIKYFDVVELIAIDSKRNIYAMIELPQKISMQTYLSLSNN